RPTPGAGFATSTTRARRTRTSAARRIARSSMRFARSARAPSSPPTTARRSTTASSLAAAGRRRAGERSSFELPAQGQGAARRIDGDAMHGPGTGAFGFQAQAILMVQRERHPADLVDVALAVGFDGKRGLPLPISDAVAATRGVR